MEPNRRLTILPSCMSLFSLHEKEKPSLLLKIDVGVVGHRDVSCGIQQDEFRFNRPKGGPSDHSAAELSFGRGMIRHPKIDAVNSIDLDEQGTLLGPL